MWFNPHSSVLGSYNIRSWKLEGSSGGETPAPHAITGVSVSLGSPAPWEPITKIFS